MKKILFLLFICCLFCISVSASSYDIIWFDIENINQIEFCDGNFIVATHDCDDINARLGIYNHNGNKLADYYSFFKVSGELYNGYILNTKNEELQIDAINEKGEILFSKNQYNSEENFNLYLWDSNQKSIDIKNNKYGNCFVIGNFVVCEEKGSYALANPYLGFLTEFDYDYANMLSSYYPGKIILANDTNVVIANAISGNYLLNVLDITGNNERISLIARNNDNLCCVSDFDTLEIMGDGYDEYIGSLYGSAIFKKDGIRYVTDSKGEVKYKGDKNVCGAAFDKYVIEENSKLGICDNKFNEILPCEYDDINIVADNVYILLKDGKYSLCNQNKPVLFGFDNMECEYNFVSADGGIYDFEGNEIIKNKGYSYYINKYDIIVYDEQNKRAGKLASENSNPLIEINGELLYTDTASRIKNNITLIPLRAMAEKTGFNVEYIEETKEIKLIKESKEIIFKIGENKAFSNGEEITLKSAPEIINNRTLVPARAVSDAFGYDIKWNGEKRLVSITTD